MLLFPAPNRRWKRRAREITFIKLHIKSHQISHHVDELRVGLKPERYLRAISSLQGF